MHLPRRLTVVAAALVAATAVSVAAAAPVNGPAAVEFTAFRVNPGPPPVDDPTERASRDLVEFVNEARRAVNLPEVAWHPQVTDAAQAHSEYQAAIRRLTHTGPGGSSASQRLVAAGYTWGNWGEAVGAGHRHPADLVDTWMSSPEHRAILLGDYLHAGAGVATTTDDVTYWTLVMASPG